MGFVFSCIMKFIIIQYYLLHVVSSFNHKVVSGNSRFGSYSFQNEATYIILVFMLAQTTFSMAHDT